MEDNSAYPLAYGRWPGRPNGSAPDLKRCCMEVRSSFGFHLEAQCARKRGYGPGEAYCKQHDPVATAARHEAARAKHAADFNRRRKEIYGDVFWRVLKQIADGHNDPRSLATETLATFHKGDISEASLPAPPAVAKE